MTPEITPSTAHITPDTPLIPAIQAWRVFLEDQGRSPYTIKAFLGDIQLLVNYLPAGHTIGQVSTTELNNFLKWLLDERGVPCSPKSYARRITTIKAFFRWLNQYGVLITDPAEKVVQQSAISPLQVVLTAAEQQRVLDIANLHKFSQKPDARPAALIELLLATGIKKGECLALTLNHVDLEAPNGPQLFVRYASPNNRYKERKIALPETWVATYHSYLKQYQPTDRIFPWSQRRLEYILEDIGKEALLDKHLSFDMCRWTCALNDWQAGMESEKLRQKLGISKIQWREIGLKLRLLNAQANLASPA